MKDHRGNVESGGATILFQPLNGIGLGHINRLAAIALAVQLKCTDARVLFALEGGNHLLLDALELPYVSIPTKAHSGSAWDRWSDADRIMLKRGLVNVLFDKVNPNLVVFDGIPSQSVLHVALERECTIAMIFRPLKNFDKYYKHNHLAIDNAQLILIPCEPHDWEGAPVLKVKARFIGQVSRPMPPMLTANLVPVPCEQPFIAISAGGGGYPGTVHFLNLAIDAVHICQQRSPNLAAVLICGPLFKEWHLLKPLPGITVIPFVPNVLNIVAAANAAIIQGGYNTVAEAERSGTPTICVPAQRVYDDQYKRSLDASLRYSWFSVFSGTSPDLLAEQIHAAIVTPRGRCDLENLSDGALLAADALVELLSKPNYP